MNLKRFVVSLSRWDNKETPRRRFNPFPANLIIIGCCVFIVISLGFYFFGLK